QDSLAYLIELAPFSGSTGRVAAQSRHVDGRHVDVQIDAVEQGTREATDVAASFAGSALAGPARIGPVAAGTRVHGGHDQGTRGEGRLGLRAHDPHTPLFQRLAERLEHPATELGELVQEEHAVVREAHFPRSRLAA